MNNINFLDIISPILGSMKAMGYSAEVPSLKALSLRKTANWSVGLLEKLHDSSNKTRFSTDDVMKCVRDHITCRIPGNLLDEFVVEVLHSLDSAFSRSSTGRQLLVYVGSFIPRNLITLVMPLCSEQVTIAAILTLPLCTNLTELYVEKADQSAITQGILCHVLKYLRRLKSLALPRQCNDGVIAVVGQNCPLLESIVLNDTAVTNSGIAWLLCCRKLNTVIMLKTEVSPPGAALLLHGLPYLNVLLYDSIADTLWYCSVNSAVSPKFNLKTVAFGATDLLTPGHLELLSQMCPAIEWLSLNSAFTYNVQTLGDLPRLTLLSVNFRGGSPDFHFVDFLRRNGGTVKCLQLFEALDLQWGRFEKLLALCPSLETLVLHECSFESFEHNCEYRKLTSRCLLKNLQILRTPMSNEQLEHLLSILPELNRLELSNLDWDSDHIRAVLEGSQIQTLRVMNWRPVGETLSASFSSLRTLRLLNVKLQQAFPARIVQLNGPFSRTALFTRGSPQFLLAEYADFSPVLDFSRSEC